VKPLLITIETTTTSHQTKGNNTR